MITGTSVILGQIDTVIEKWTDMKRRSKYDDLSDMPDEETSELITAIDSAINRLSPVGSRYNTHCRRIMTDYGVDHSGCISYLIGILKALREAYELGYLETIHELVHADLFSDFLDAANYFLDEGYKDPAAVMAGGVLEEHLRKLCVKNSIPIGEKNRPKKADRLNSDLAAGGIYDKLNQKSITAWLDLRNKAAHGKYGEYTKEQVALMLQAVRDFIARYPA